MTTIEQQILDYARNRDQFVSRDVIDALNLNGSNATRKLKVMCEKENPAIERIEDDTVRPSHYIYRAVRT